MKKKTKQINHNHIKLKLTEIQTRQFRMRGKESETFVCMFSSVHVNSELRINISFTQFFFSLFAFCNNRQKQKEIFFPSRGSMEIDTQSIGNG